MRQEARLAVPLLVLGVYLMYFSPIHTVYHFADEAGYLFNDTPITSGFLFESLKFYTFWHGRPFAMLFYVPMAKFTFVYEHGLQIVRIAQFCMSVAVAAYLFWLLRKRDLSHMWALFVVLLIWSQPAFQILHVYAMTAPYILGIACSYLSFALIFRSKPGRWLVRAMFSFALLMVGWLTFQAAPFAGLAPLCYYALTSTEASWPEERKKYLLFVSLLLVSMVVFVAGYRLLLNYWDGEQYHHTRQVFSLLSGMDTDVLIGLLRPANYIGPFEWWNYLLPVGAISDGASAGPMLRALSYATMAVWLVVFGLSFYLEAAAAATRFVAQKYVLVLVALALAFSPLIADGFSFRQHLYIASSPVLILIFFHGVSRIYGRISSNTSRHEYLKAVPVAVLAFVSLGAQANVYRGIVLPSYRFDSFVQTEMLRQKNKDYQYVLIVNADNLCAREPCRGFMYRRMSIAQRQNASRKYYRLMLYRLGMNSKVPIGFKYTRKPPGEVRKNDAIVIDHRVLREYVGRT